MLKESNYKFSNNQFSPNAISHRELNILLNRAKKETSSIEISENFEDSNQQEFNDLISNWTESSKKILLMLNLKQEILTKNKNSKSIMAYGAMAAHINMALQALKATELDQ